MTELYFLVFAAALGTYVWRGLGVLLSGRIKVNSALFNWVACVAYAMVAGLISRILLMPSGVLAQTALAERLIACALALAAYYLSRRNLLIGVAVGVAAIMAMQGLR
ncbi:MAG TPA: AzlD domain-containing protein [Burkholderiales bacterium]|jgi:branched-subunit amino acid transport protein|nr:AzlD domain-containing protein [Burkholderiales bacterium]